MKKIFNRLKFKFILVLFLLPLYAILYKIYIPRINAFGCFDDCFNIVGGFFLQNGKSIYSDFFFDHQPIAAYISLFIQNITTPINIFELILRHHQFILVFGFVFSILIVLRFGFRAFLFIIFYEFSKFYLFGDRFLAEAYIVYPLVYLLGLSLLKVSKERLLSIDYILSVFFCWLIIFSREPYIPLALFLFLIILFYSTTREKFTSIGIFLLLCLITLLPFNIKDYFFNVVTINFQTVLPNQLKEQIYGGPLQMFFYPIFILFDGPWNVFKMLLMGLDVLFLALVFKVIKNKHLFLFIFILFALFLANLRPNVPGKLFYESFHMIIWYAFFIFITVYLIFKEKKNIILFSLCYLTVLFFMYILSPANFIYDKINRQEEFLTNYGQTLQEGEVIRILSSPSDTLFLDGSDDLVYWQAKKISQYKYTWYTSVMPYFPIYLKAREEMFEKSPPDFYRGLGNCKQITRSGSPRFIEENYVRLLVDGRKSCLFVIKDKAEIITDSQEEKLTEWHYSLPPDEKI